MELGTKILNLRKQRGLSQEQLGELIGVTRQTISNWELDETSPNPEQLKKLSNALNISIDELLDNDIRGTLGGKVSNIEKLAGIIIKILKGIGVILIVLLVIDIVAFLVFNVYKRVNTTKTTVEVEMHCTIDDNNYVIKVSSDEHFICSNCSDEMQNNLKNNYVDFSDISKTEKNILEYFENNNGNC